MSRNAKYFLLLVSLLLVSSNVGAVVIDFDSFPDLAPVPNGTVITDQYAGVGALFGSTGGGPIAGVFAGEASSPPNFLFGNPDSFQPITMDLLTPTDLLEVTLISVGHMVLTSTAFASDLTTILDSVSVSNPDGPPDGLNNKDPISLSGPGITRVVFEITVPVPGVDGFGIDDLRFEPATTVAEPGLVLFLIGGVAGLFGWRRRLASGKGS